MAVINLITFPHFIVLVLIGRDVHKGRRSANFEQSRIYRKVKRKSKERTTPILVRLAETYHYRRNRSTQRRVVGSLK